MTMPLVLGAPAQQYLVSKILALGARDHTSRARRISDLSPPARQAVKEVARRRPRWQASSA